MRYPNNMRLEEYFKRTRPDQQVNDIEIANHGLGGDYKITLKNYGSDGYATYVTAPNGTLFGCWTLFTVQDFYPFKRWVDSVFTYNRMHWVFAMSKDNKLVSAGIDGVQLNLENDYPVKLEANQIALCYTKQLPRYTKKSCVDNIYVQPICVVPEDVMKAIVYFEWYKVNCDYCREGGYKPKLLGQYICHGTIDDCRPPYVLIKEMYPKFTGVYADTPRNYKWPKGIGMQYTFMAINNRGVTGPILGYRPVDLVSADVIENIRWAISRKD